MWRRPARDTSGQVVYDALPPSGTEMKTTAYKEEEIEKPQRTSPKHSWGWIIVTQFLGLLWVAPVIYLLYLNFSSFIIGPSVWCPRGHCPADPLASDAVGRAQRFDKHDHNTLGALQFVAKALELWFIFVACALLYNIVMTLASREYGLPVGLLTSPVEFADPRSLVDTVRSAIGSRHQRSASISTGSKFLLAIFIAFVAFMCLIVNLMGPAVAVLVIPTLQWVNLPKNASHTLLSFQIDDLPVNRSDGGFVFPNCYTVDIEDRRYSCNADAYAASLDTWVDAAVASGSQIVDSNNNTMYDGISPEGRVFFTFNVTNNITQVAWVPNRQVLRELSSDLDLFTDASLAASASDKKYIKQSTVWNEHTEDSNYTFFTNQTKVETPTSDFAPYINSLQTILKRQGPVAGAFGNVYSPTTVSQKELGGNKWVRCFGGYWSILPGPDKYNDDATYTKCLRLGEGWDSTYHLANFSVYGDTSSATVYVYFSDRSTYLAEGLNSTVLNACHPNSPSITDDENCSWDSLFDDTQYLPKDPDALRTNLITVELQMPKKYPGQYIVLEAVTYLYNATYTLDTSPVSNPNFLVQVDGVPDPSIAGLQPVVVDPDWLLAAWSVDHDGALFSNRSASSNLIRGLEAFFSQTSFEDSSDEASNDYTSSYSSLTHATRTRSAAEASQTGLEATSTDVTEASRTRSPTSTTDRNNKRQVDTTSSTATSTFPSTSYTAATTTVAVRPDNYENVEYNDNFYDASSDSSAVKAPDDLTNFIYFSFLQSLSMVTFNKTNVTAPGPKHEDLAHPTLSYWAMVHVWGYGIDSRTSKFGVAVTSVGCVVVLASTIVGLLVRRRQRSLTEIIVAAIEHKHMGELDHAGGDGELAARFRYKIQEDPSDGRVRFVPL
ncbi:hypothetical protein G7Y79_00067g095510 [Physcia stellaris]|nr:hypothetical protein G7Y79_00067g095510 [Physcia stellaris]